MKIHPGLQKKGIQEKTPINPHLQRKYIEHVDKQ